MGWREEAAAVESARVVALYFRPLVGDVVSDALLRQVAWALNQLSDSISVRSIQWVTGPGDDVRRIRVEIDRGVV